MALTALTRERAVAYLKGRAEVGQKTLDTERQAIQAMTVNVTGQLPLGATLPGGLAERIEACRRGEHRDQRGEQSLHAHVAEA